MNRLPSLRRNLLLFMCLPLAAMVAGGDTECEFEGGGFPIFLPSPRPPVVVIPDYVTIEVVNETGLAVDPGVFINGALLDLGIFGPFEADSFDVDCFEGDVIEVDAIQLDPFADVLSANVPYLEEGFEFLCGDVITFYYTEDVSGTFFVDVAVNDVLLPL